MRIQKNIPMPKTVNYKPEVKRIGKMKIGDSVLVETHNERQKISICMRRHGFKPRSKRIDDSYRVWRVA